MNRSIIRFAIIAVIAVSTSCISETKRGTGLILDNTYLYSRPDLGSSRRAKINRGEAIFIKDGTTAEKADEWIQISLSDEETAGWVKKEFVHQGPKIAITLTEKAFLYIRPDEQSNPIKTLQSGTSMFVLQQKGKWKKVSIDSSLSGWLNTSMYEEGIK